MRVVLWRQYEWMKNTLSLEHNYKIANHFLRSLPCLLLKQYFNFEVYITLGQSCLKQQAAYKP